MKQVTSQQLRKHSLHTNILQRACLNEYHVNVGKIIEAAPKYITGPRCEVANFNVMFLHVDTESFNLTI